jgi:hypothetical protein
MVEYMKYSRSCTKIENGVRCDASPATLVRVGADLIDLCPRHAVAAMGIGAPVKLPPVTAGKALRFADEAPATARPKRQPELRGTAGELIVRFVATHPNSDRRQIGAGLDMSHHILKEWLPKLVTRGYLRAQFLDRVCYYRIMEPGPLAG